MYEDWEQVKKISGGSGCEAYIVRKKGGDGKLFFLKEFIGDDSKKRARFARETLMYATLEKIGCIPKLVEYEIKDFKNKDARLYYVCEYIEGIDLEQYARNRMLTEEQVLDLFRQLLTIVSLVHAQEAVHRDIKPQNIIVNEEGKLFLVDFGIAHMDLENNTFKQSANADEFGNRFLKLPDHTGGSGDKRAPESDLSMCCGIALYLLCKQYPRTLMDEEGNYPHQRPEAAQAITKLQYRFYWNIIFARAFQHDLRKRWSSAEEILNILSKMIKEEDNIEDYRKLLQTQAAALDKNYFKTLKQALENVYQPIEVMLKMFLDKEAPGFKQETSWTVYHEGIESRQSQTRALRKPDRQKVTFDLQAEKDGGQVVGSITIDGGEKIELARVPFGEGIPNAEYELIIRQLKRYVLPALAALVAK